MNKSELDYYRKKHREMQAKGRRCPDCAKRAERIKAKVHAAGKTLTGAEKPKR